MPQAPYHLLVTLAMARTGALGPLPTVSCMTTRPCSNIPSIPDCAIDRSGRNSYKRGNDRVPAFRAAHMCASRRSPRKVQEQEPAGTPFPVLNMLKLRVRAGWPDSGI